VPGLGASFGRGAATNYQQDMENSDCILFMGSNMAEAQPVGFRWPMKAKEKGGTLIHVDPRFTRMSAVCDLYVGIRSGSDIAFLGGLVNYVLGNDRWFHEYVLAYTNASTIIEEGFRDTEDLAGLFSGFDQQHESYNAKQGHWGYKECRNGYAPQPNSMKAPYGRNGHACDGSGEPFTSPYQDMTNAQRDPTLQHPHCIMQILRRHFARYTPEVVSQVCGCTPEEFVRVAELLCTNSGRERTTCIAYALGWTQHTIGVQIIRTAGILQLLLGNMGRPGGGIMALRGHSTIQGATDVSTLYDTLPGYLPQPAVHERAHEDLTCYIDYGGMPTGYWANFSKFIVSLLKAWYGDAATPDNDFAFSWLPRVDGDYSQLAYFDRMAKGAVEGYFLFGQNPGGGGPNAGLHRAGLRNLKWMVVLDWFETESATFWKNDPNGPPPSEIGTEVFFIPAAAAPEKEGSLTNTQRLLQWHKKAIDPSGDCRSDAWFLYNLGTRLKQLYAGSTDPKDQPLLNLTWDYDFDEQPRLPDGTLSRIEGEPDLEKVLMEINGHRLDEVDPRTGRPRLVSGYSELKTTARRPAAAGSTAASSPSPAATGRRNARSRITRSNRTGASLGRTMSASCTTAPRPIPKGGPGRNARNWSGGTPKSGAGWDPTNRTSNWRSGPITYRQRAQRAWRPSPALSPLSRRPTDWVGCIRRASKTGLCRRTMSRWSRRWAICSIPNTITTQRCAFSRDLSITSPTRRPPSIPWWPQPSVSLSIT
jgi:formate dehydrogenase major subunit